MTFDEVVKKHLRLLSEEDNLDKHQQGRPQVLSSPDSPAPPDTQSALPDIGENIPTEKKPGTDEQLDNEYRRTADPTEYTKSILSLLIDSREGVSPEMFNEYLESISLESIKAVPGIENKADLKRFYKNFYNILGDLVGAQAEPDNAGGGVGRAGPSGPGVN